MSEVLKSKDYDKVKKIIDVLQKEGAITPKEAELISGKSPATTRRYMKLLVETGLIVQEGSTNNIIYRIC